MQPYWFMLGVLAVWRITHLLIAEDGPWNVVIWLRRKAADGFFGAVLDCFYCLSLWIAAPVALLIGYGIKAQLFAWLALSGGAILLQRLIPDRSEPMPPYFEHGEHDHVMLRKIAESNSTGVGNPET